MMNVAGLLPYPEYKETTIEWLDGLPSHWNELSLKRVAFSENSGCYGSEPEIGAYILPVATTAQIDQNGNFATQRMPLRGFTNQEVLRYGCKAGDILVVKSSGSAANVISGKAGIVREDTPPFVFSNFLMRFVARCELVRPEFLFVVLTSNLTRERVRRMVSTTTYPNLRVNEYCAALLPIPPIEEQEGIVRFLGWVNGRIERTIRLKRRTIALLNEQKQAIIHRAVTRGLDGDAPLRPSGIPWLGDIPAHWEVRRLKHLLKDKLTYGANEAAEFTNPAWPRYIRITDFRADGSLRPNTFRSLPPHIAVNYMVHPGDILFARSGATVGKAFIVVELTGDACHAGYLIRARPNRDIILPEFLFAFTQSIAFATWKDSTFNTATIQNIGADKYANLSVPLPPLAEQQAILDAIEEKKTPLLNAISRFEREIELLQEYRTRLVADVVTGKLDVRPALPHLPPAGAEPPTAAEPEEEEDTADDDL